MWLLVPSLLLSHWVEPKTGTVSKSLKLLVLPLIFMENVSSVHSLRQGLLSFQCVPGIDSDPGGHSLLSEVLVLREFKWGSRENGKPHK